MTSELDLKPVHLLYTEYILDQGKKDLASKLWNTIPSTIGEASVLLEKNRSKYGEVKDEIEYLKKAMKKNLRKLGLLTGNVEKNIEDLHEGVVESGQQPMALGGPSLILNKIGYSKSICNISKENYVPLFYVADYDGVQSELLNIRIPSPSSRGLLINYPVEPEYNDVPIRNLQNPNEKWLKKTLDKIMGNYKGILKDVELSKREQIINNLSHVFTIIRTSYYSTENVSDWSTKIIGIILNIESNLGIPLLNASDQDIRILFQSGYEFLLSEPNRSNFIKFSNEATENILKAGYRPQIGVREDNYVPFFYECENEECYNRRIEMKLGEEKRESVIKGKCPSCQEEYEFSFNSKKPDLSEIIEYISPRVDSRQIIVNSVLPVLAHIGGPGETSYYAEIIPATDKMCIPFPTFLRYSRNFYNTPWNKMYSDSLKSKGLPTLMNDRLFDALNKWVTSRNINDGLGLNEAHNEIMKFIEATYSTLINEMETLNRDIMDIKARLKDPDNRDVLIKELRIKQKKDQEIELYLSSAFGRFSPEKFGQEVNWAWFDLAIVSGINDLMGVYDRQYNENTPNSTMYFVNLT